MIWPQQFPFIAVVLAPSCSHYCWQSWIVTALCCERTAVVNEENYHIATLISSLSFKKDKSNINSAVNFNSTQQLWETSAWWSMDNQRHWAVAAPWRVESYSWIDRSRTIWSILLFDGVPKHTRYFRGERICMWKNLSKATGQHSYIMPTTLWSIVVQVQLPCRCTAEEVPQAAAVIFEAKVELIH